MNYAHFKPIRRKVLLHKCLNALPEEHDGSLYWRLPDSGLVVPQKTAEQTTMHEVVAVADDCELFGPDAVGKFVLTPELTNRMWCIDAENQYWVAEETVLTPVLYEH